MLSAPAADSLRRISGHIVCGCLLRLCGDTQAVGTHIGNQTDCTQSVDIHAFVQFLCHLHGALGLKAQAIGGILLQVEVINGGAGWRLVTRFFTFCTE